MKEKVKVVDIGSQRFQVRKLPANVGSFILMRMTGAAATAAQKMGQASEKSPEPVPAASEDTKPSGEQMVRMLFTAAFMHGATYQEFEFVQGHALFAVSHEEKDIGFLPIMTEPGKWAGTKKEDELGDNYPLLMQLVMQVMIFNFADFFEQGGIDSLTGPMKSSATSR